MEKADAVKFGVMGAEMKTMTKKLDDHIKDQSAKWKDLYKKLDGLGEKLDKKYAGKWVETVSVGALIGIIVGVAIFMIRGG
jgi:hypothetical protein